MLCHQTAPQPLVIRQGTPARRPRLIGPEAAQFAWFEHGVTAGERRDGSTTRTVCEVRRCREMTTIARRFDFAIGLSPALTGLLTRLSPPEGVLAVFLSILFRTHCRFHCRTLSPVLRSRHWPRRLIHLLWNSNTYCFCAFCSVYPLRLREIYPLTALYKSL